MPPTMQPMLPSRTKRARLYKRFEVVQVGPIRLFFSHFELIGFETDSTKLVICAPVAFSNGVESEMNSHRTFLEADKSKWLSQSDFAEKWTEASSVYFRRSLSG